MPIRPLDQTTGAAGTSNSSSSGRAFLEKSNPALASIIREQPGVGALIDKLDRNGHILQPRPGDKKADVEFAMWSHSKQSGGMPVEPYKDLIVAYQYDPKGRDLGIGGGSWCQGKVVGVFRLDQMAFKSASEAKAFNPALKVKEFEPGKFVHVSDDPTYRGSYEWSPMTVSSHGEDGKPFTMRWAIIGVDDRGNVLGGGYSGWEGREVDGHFGKDVATEMPDH